MNARDKAIIADIERFRYLTRDDIAELYFGHTRHPITQTNLVLKRLRRDGYVKCSTERRKYVYYAADRKLKADSQKVAHFLAIADYYKRIRAVEEPRVFEVEPKLGGKGQPEPDVFTIWKGAPWYVEIQRSTYTDKQMAEKLNRYEAYYNSGEWKREPWQPQNRAIFPYVWIIGAAKYNVGERPFRVYQASVDEMMARIKR
ncbi:replication-relaxation family protein (plasmid) [Paenibacillus sp. JNUCC32]|uniref:replication-relaxation family protein n=1 Tax=Paenibacillus sp. JNUCC32 TaxID=2777984 RepID=UPI0017878A8E|nr:replication-relaxation family protein [Paenibacillus sp. JNUCC-32]QOT13754.1 replication-relaxation family protein [Paenibacillus sp. JNUCC-32]